MSKKLQVALQVSADFNAARRETKALKQDLTDTSKAVNTQNTAQKALNQTLHGTTTAMQKMSNATDMKKGVQELKQYDSQLGQVDKSLNKVETSGKSSLGQLTKLAAAIGGISAGISLVDAVDQWGQYDVRIKQVTQSEADYELVKKRLLETANNTYRPLQEQQELYIRTSKSIQGLGYNTSQTLDIADSFSYLLTTNATSADKAQTALDAFSKSIVNNKVSGEQWQSMVIAMPTLTDALSKSTGIARSQIETMGNAGTISLKQLTEAFRLTKEENQAMAAEMDNTRKDALTALKNNMTDLLGEFNKTYQVTQTLSSGIVLLAENVDTIGAVAATAAIAAFSKYVIDSAIAVGQKTTAVIADTRAALIAINAKRAEALEEQKLAIAHMQETLARNAAIRQKHADNLAHWEVTNAANAEAAAKTRLAAANKVVAATSTGAATGARALMGLLGGPAGLIALAAGAAATFFLMKDGSDTATDAFNVQRASVAELTNEYKKLNAEKKAIYMQELTEQLADEEKALAATSKEMNQHLAAWAAYEKELQAVGGTSDNTRKAIEQYFAEVKQGGEVAKTAFDRLAQTKLLNDSELAKVAKLGEQFNQNSNQAESTRQKIAVLNGETVTLSKTADQAAMASNNMAGGLGSVSSNAANAAQNVQSLGKAYDDYMAKVRNSRNDNMMIAGLMSEGQSEKLARMATELLAAKNADPNATQTYGSLTADEMAELKASIAAEEKISNISEQRKKQEEAITKEKEKQKKISEQSQKINSTVMAQAKKYNYEGLENQYGLPRGLLASVSMQESRGNPNAVSPVGAKGAFQFMPKTAERFGLKDRTDIAASAEAAAKYLSILLKMFNGDLNKAIMAYNAGEGNVQNGRAYGFKETQNYLPSVKRYMAGYNGLDDENAQATLQQIVSARQEFLSNQKQTQLNIDMRFATEAQKLKLEYDALIEQINNAGYDQETLKTRLEQAEQEYQDKLTKRPDVLKRALDSVNSIEGAWLEASGKTLEASLKSIEDKWKQPKADLAQLIKTEQDPAKAEEFQSMLVKIDFVIEKEQLTLQFNDAMKQLDELEALRKQRQETQKLKFESGQISQPQYAEGLKLIDAEMVPQLQTIAEQARVIAEQLGDAFNVEKLNAFVVGLTQIDTEFKKFLPTAEQLNERIAGGLTDAIMDFADGTKSAGDAFRQFASDFLREIAQMILKQMMFNMVKSAMGSMGGIGGGIASAIGGAFGGFMEGGHTGYGRRDEVAGVVHRDEWVITKPRTSEPGAKEFLSYFERYGMKGLNKFNGYMNGGLVGAPTINAPAMPTAKLSNPIAEIAQSSSFNANQNFYLVDDPSRILDTLNSSQGQENLVVMLSRDPAKFKSALKIG